MVVARIVGQWSEAALRHEIMLWILGGDFRREESVDGEGM